MLFRSTETFLVVETAVKHLTHELEDLRIYQSKRLATVKKQFEESMNTMTLAMNNPNDLDPSNSSSVITTGQCLGCGRLAAIQNQSGPPSSHALETFRGGFKIPLSVPPITLFKDLTHGPLGGSETQVSPLHSHLQSHLSRPMSAILQSKNVDILGEQVQLGVGVGETEGGDLSAGSFSLAFTPQYSTVRPKTSSKNHN